MTRHTSRDAIRLTWRRTTVDGPGPWGVWTLTGPTGITYGSITGEPGKWHWKAKQPGYVAEEGHTPTLQAARSAVRALFTKQSWQEYAYRVERTP